MTIRAAPSPATVLVVEDDAAIREGLVDALGFDGYRVLQAPDAPRGTESALRSACDLVLLDLMLPGGDGFDVLKEIRRLKPALPVIVLTARGREADRVRGLRLGADDYVVKPFSMRELILRVRAVLRRSDTGPQPEAAQTLEFGVLKLDLEGHRVWVEGEEVVLTALEFRLLRTLVQRRGRVQTREILLSHVWEMSGDLTTRTVDTHVRRLRKKLGAAAAYIETLRGVGYRFQPEPD
jgi:two-component system phosphate regulon response regulator PhoB